MRRIAIFAIIGAASLLAVSIGVGWQSPRPTPHSQLPVYQTPKNDPGPAGQPPAYEPVPADQPPSYYPDPPDQPPAYSPGNESPTPRVPVALVATEPMTVKVYSVPDLVSAVQFHRAAPSSSANPGLSQAMQQLQVQTAQYESVQYAPSPGPSDELTTRLERLKKALKVTAPARSWEDGGGDGAIEVYPEALCLIVRQTVAGHEAIADLLSQLRATQDVQIELVVEIVTFEGAADDLVAQAARMLNKDLSPEEVAEFRKCGVKTATSSIVRMANGRSANTGIPELPLHITAVASADRSMVEFRAEIAVPMEQPDSARYQSLSQTRSVLVGKTLAYMASSDGSLVLLVTPRIMDRSPATDLGIRR